MRNWGIRSLRALWTQCYQLAPERRVIAQQMVDEELVARGALSTADHRKAVFEKRTKQETSK